MQLKYKHACTSAFYTILKNKQTNKKKFYNSQRTTLITFFMVKLNCIVKCGGDEGLTNSHSAHQAGCYISLLHIKVFAHILLGCGVIPWVRGNRVTQAETPPHLDHVEQVTTLIFP